MEGEHNGNGPGHTVENKSAAAEETAQGNTQESAQQTDRTESQRKPRAEREDAFDAAAWLLQGLAGLSQELRHNDLGLPSDFWVHAYAARREALLAARVLVDAALENCAKDEAAQAKDKKKPPKRGQVSIDFG